MLLTEYLEEVSATIDEYSKTGFIFSAEIKRDMRTENIGLIKIFITFTDESKLYVTEYLDLSVKIEKLSYSYHYQDRSGRVLFRYDNAAHKPPLRFAHHKHVGNSVFQCKIPDLEGILEEITDYLMPI
jgi:hypothetical protein